MGLRVTKELLFSVTKKDLEFKYFRAGGNGGQKQNKTDSGCRITHRPSGAVAESREHATQLQNKRAAFKRLAVHPKMKVWISNMSYVMEKGRTIEQDVERSMRPGNLRVEVKDEKGRWSPGGDI